MATKHTQGPWIFESGMVWKANEIDGKIPIAKMDRESGNGTTPTERDANARLIAMAPGLLYYLQMAWGHNADHRLLSFNQLTQIREIIIEAETGKDID